MESVGERLRRVRIEQGVELNTIAEELCIGSRYLQAIENGDLKVLPGGFFSKSFYRQYGNYLGICDQQFEAAVENLFGGEDPAAVSQRSPLLTSTGLPPMPTGSNRTRVRKPLVSLAVLLLVVAACSGLYALWQRMQQPSLSESAEVVSPPSQVASTPPMEAATQPEGSAPSVNPESPTDVVLNLSATEKVWISVTSGGKVLFSGVLEPSQSKALDAVENARILIGNAGGLDVQWKGRSLGPIGPRGQVRTVVLGPEGFEILLPKQDAEPKL
jgi:cytoskeletal protein RodZ